MFRPMIRFPLLAAVLALTSTVHSEQVLESGSFEWPPVTQRKVRSEGGDLKKSAMNAEWLSFRDKADDAGGKLILGLTNEISHSGRQSMFVQFDKVTKQGASAILASDFLTILPNQAYKVGIWGRVDKKNPVALDTRIPYLRLRVDFFKKGVDEDTKEPSIEQVGEPVFRTQSLPGSRKRKPLFNSNEWNQFWAMVKSPEDATLVKLTWTWETPRIEGETNGIMFFDDVTIDGAAPAKEDPFADDPEVQAERKAAANNPNLVQPEQEKPINVTPLDTAPMEEEPGDKPEDQAEKPNANGDKPAEKAPAKPAKPAAPKPAR